MKVAMELDGKFPTSGSLKLGTLYEIATLSPEQREQHHTLKSGEVKAVDEMTVRELREVKKALKEAEAKAKQAEIARLLKVIGNTKLKGPGVMPSPFCIG